MRLRFSSRVRPETFGAKRSNLLTSQAPGLLAGCLFLDSRSSLILHTIMSTRMAFPVDRSLEFDLVSTKTPLFVDRSIKLTGFPPKWLFSWRCSPNRPVSSPDLLWTEGYGNSSSRIERSIRSILLSCWLVAL